MEREVEYSGETLTAVYAGTKEACGRLCYLSTCCEFWSFGYHGEHENSRYKKCFLKAGDTGKTKSNYFISGQKACGKDLGEILHYVIAKLDGVALLMTGPPPTIFTTLHNRLIRQDRNFLAVQPIFPVQQNRHNF